MTTHLDAITLMADALRRIRDARDYHAEHCHYPAAYEITEFDDWAADIADTVLSTVGMNNNVKPSALPVTVYIAVHCTDEYGESPRYASIEITDELLTRIQEMRDLCFANRLSSASEYSYLPEYNNELRTENDQMFVNSDYFWFSAQPKHCDYLIETGCQSIDGFLEDLRAGIKHFGVTAEDIT